MPAKPATHRHIKHSHAHSFDFRPREWLDAADWRDLEPVLIAQRGSESFPGLRAWRLRLDRRSPDSHKTPWAIEVPFGAFSSFSEGLATPEDDQEGFERVLDKIRDDRRASTVEKRPGPVGLGFSLRHDVFVREGVTYYRETAVEVLRHFAPNPPLFWALHHLLREACNKPEVITGRPYGENGRLPRLRPFVPPEQRKKMGLRPVRGPSWLPEEDALLRDFFQSGKALTIPYFDVLEKQHLLAGGMPRDREHLLAKWKEHIVLDFHHRRSFSSIKQRVHHLNQTARRKFMVNGRIPKSSRKFFEKAYLGIPERGTYARQLANTGWLLICQEAGHGPFFLDFTKTLLLRTSTIGRAQSRPFKVVAFRKQSDIAVNKLRVTLEDALLCHDWYRPLSPVLEVVVDAQAQTIAKLEAGDKLYVKEAKRLHAWLAWDLLKHVPEDPSS